MLMFLERCESWWYCPAAVVFADGMKPFVVAATAARRTKTYQVTAVAVAVAVVSVVSVVSVAGGALDAFRS